MDKTYQLKTGELVDLSTIVHIGNLEWEILYPYGYSFEITFQFVSNKVKVYTKAPNKWKTLSEEEKRDFNIFCEDSYNSFVDVWRKFKDG